MDTSWALAPGSGVTTTTNGSWMSGSSSWLSCDHEKMPPRSNPSVTSTVTLRFAMANWVRRITSRSSGSWLGSRCSDVSFNRKDFGEGPAFGARPKTSPDAR